MPSTIIEESHLRAPWPQLATYLNWAISLTFLAEIVIMLAVVPSRRGWLRTHPGEIATEGRFTGVEWIPGREPPAGAPEDILPALALILEHLCAIDISVEQDDSDAVLSDDALAVIGVRARRPG